MPPCNWSRNRLACDGIRLDQNPTGQPAPPLRAAALAKEYPTPDGPLLVFSGVDLEVRRGERVALTGESGAGKSTLLHLLGLLDTPSAGSVYILGEPASSLPEPRLAELRNRCIGFIWQRNTLLMEFTALENVMMPLLIRGAKKAHAAERAMELLDEVSLAARARHLAGELSGGEQQRVALARALAGNPSILLADEPTGSLDERTAAQVIELMERDPRPPPAGHALCDPQPGLRPPRTPRAPPRGRPPPPALNRRPSSHRPRAHTARPPPGSSRARARASLRRCPAIFGSSPLRLRRGFPRPQPRILPSVLAEGEMGTVTIFCAVSGAAYGGRAAAAASGHPRGPISLPAAAPGGPRLPPARKLRRPRYDIGVGVPAAPSVPAAWGHDV